MPYVSVPGDAPSDSDERRGRTDFPGLRGYRDTREADPARSTGTNPIYKYVYDYSNLRRYQIKFAPGVSVDVKSWNGSVWSTVSGFSTTGIGNPIDIVPFKDALSSVGSGYGLLAIYSDGTIKTILSTVTLTHTLAGLDIKDSNGKLQTKLIQTTNGVYYVTPSGYGKIEITTGVLTSKWVKIIDQSNSLNLMQTITPISNTFLYSNGRIITLAKVSYKKSIVDERFIDDTYLLQLDPVIQEKATDSVLSFDFLLKNIPRATFCVKSPRS